MCFPETLNVPGGKAKGTIEGREETNLTASRGTSHKVFCYTQCLYFMKAEVVLRPRELVSFDPRHCLLQSEDVVELGG